MSQKFLSFRNSNNLISESPTPNHIFTFRGREGFEKFRVLFQLYCERVEVLLGHIHSKLAKFECAMAPPETKIPPPLTLIVLTHLLKVHRSPR